MFRDAFPRMENNGDDMNLNDLHTGTGIQARLSMAKSCTCAHVIVCDIDWAQSGLHPMAEGPGTRGFLG